MDKLSQLGYGYHSMGLKPVQEQQTPAGPAFGRRLGGFKITILGPEGAIRADGGFQARLLTGGQRVFSIQLPKALRDEMLPPDQIFDDLGPPAEAFFFLSRVEIITEGPADIVLKIHSGHHGVVRSFWEGKKGR
jgi:hypothetical protein